MQLDSLTLAVLALQYDGPKAKVSVSLAEPGYIAARFAIEDSFGDYPFDASAMNSYYAARELF